MDRIDLLCLAAVEKGNTCHLPSGSSTGGEFCSTKGSSGPGGSSGSASTLVKVTKIRSIDKDTVKSVNNAFVDAPPELTQAMQNAFEKRPLRAIYHSADGFSFYLPNRKIEKGGEGSIALRRDAQTEVIQHEVGHALDAAMRPAGTAAMGPLNAKVGTGVGQGYGLNEGWASSRASFRSAAKTDTTVFMAKSDRIQQELKDRQDAILADAFGAMSMNRVGWGHSISHLKSMEPAPYMEIFANLVVMKARKNKSAYEFFKTHAPNTTNEFEKILRGE